MFSAHCPTCDRSVLLTPGDILGYSNATERIEVTYRCLCDAVNTWITGKASSERGTKVATRLTARQLHSVAA